MAEILTYAKDHWMTIAPQEVRDKWTVDQWNKYARRLIKGNPIIVKPNGWKWGKAECPPDYIVLKIPNMTVKEAEAYLLAEYDYTKPIDEHGNYEVKYRKKYVFAPTDIDAALALSQTSISMNKNTFESKITVRAF